MTTSTLHSYRMDSDAITVGTRSGSMYLLGTPRLGEIEAVERVVRQFKAQQCAASLELDGYAGTTP